MSNKKWHKTYKHKKKIKSRRNKHTKQNIKQNRLLANFLKEFIEKLESENQLSSKTVVITKPRRITIINETIDSVTKGCE